LSDATEHKVEIQRTLDAFTNNFKQSVLVIFESLEKLEEYVQFTGDEDKFNLLTEKVPEEQK